MQSISEGAEVGQLIDQMLGYFRDVMTQSVGCDQSQLLYALPSQQTEISNVAQQLGIQTLLAIIQVLDQTAARMRVSTHTRTLAEMAMVRICTAGRPRRPGNSLLDQQPVSGDQAMAAPAAKKNVG